MLVFKDRPIRLPFHIKFNRYLSILEILLKVTLSFPILFDVFGGSVFICMRINQRQNSLRVQ